MRDLIGHSRGLDGLFRVAAAHHRCGAGNRHRLRQCDSAPVEWLLLEHAHGAIPDYGLGGADHERIAIDGEGPDIHADLAVRNGIHDLAFGVFLNLGHDHMIHGQHQLVLKFQYQLAREIQLVVFHKRLTYRLAFRLHKCISHGTADQQLVHDFAQVRDHFDLVGNLGAAEDRHTGPRRVPGRHGEVLQLLLHEQSGGGLRHVSNHAHGGGVRAMRRAERVVHIDVAQRGQLFRKLRIVLFFFRVEAQILQQQDFAGRRPHGFHFGTDTIGCHLDRTAQQFFQALSHRFQAHFRIGFAFRTAQMRGQNDAGPLLQRVADGREGCFDALVAGDLLAAGG